MRTPHTIAISCKNKYGKADLYICSVTATEKEVKSGLHYERAEKKATANGYEAPFICFDASEQQTLIAKLVSLELPIPFTLVDKADERQKTLSGSVLIGWDGISIQLDGYSDFHSQDNKGYVVYTEFWDNSANVQVYADINSQDPTDTISLENALNRNRYKNQGN